MRVVILVLRLLSRPGLTRVVRSGLVSQSTPTLFFGYREPQTPRRIRVRWPSGKAVEVEYAPDLTAPVQRLQAP